MTITEWCSSCENEVELKEGFVKQKCPSCGELLLPCSMCNQDEINCSNCLAEKDKYTQGKIE